MPKVDPIILTEKEVQIYRKLKASGAIFPDKDPHAFRKFVRCYMLDQSDANLQLTLQQWNTHPGILVSEKKVFETLGLPPPGGWSSTYDPDSVINSHPSPADPFYGHRYKAQYQEPPAEAVDLALTAFILDKPLMLHDAWLTHQHGSLFARLRYYPPMEEFKTEWRDMVQAWLVIQGQSFPEMSKDIQKSFCMPEKQSYNNGVEYRFQVQPPEPVPPVKFHWIKRHADEIYWVGLAIGGISMFIGLYWNTH